MTAPILYEIKTGWAAANPDPKDRWAVHGATPEEAVRQFEETVERHKEMDARPDPPRSPSPQ